MELWITLDRGEDGTWVVECPSIPGCVSQGKTKDEAIANIKDAIRLCMEVRAECEMQLAEDRRSSCQAARGMWRDRDDLPCLTELRIEMNRDFES